MLSLLKNLIPAIRGGFSLTKLWKSKTTTNQYLGIVPAILAIALVFIGNTLPDTPLSDIDTQLVLLTLIMAAISPIISRILAFTKRPELTLGQEAVLYVVRVKNKKDDSWKAFKGVLLDALKEKWDLALIPKNTVDSDGKWRALVYDLRSKKYTGEEIRISEREISEIISS